jgi:hypothetical protein
MAAAKQDNPVIRRVVAILWPSFITAGIATIVFNTVFDPLVLFVDFDISRLGAYSISFFLFWMFGVITAMATCFFLRPCSAVSQDNAQRSQQPPAQ